MLFMRIREPGFLWLCWSDIWYPQRGQSKRWSRPHEVLPQLDPDHHPSAERGSFSPRHPGRPRTQPPPHHHVAAASSGFPPTKSPKRFWKLSSSDNNFKPPVRTERSPACAGLAPLCKSFTVQNGYFYQPTLRQSPAHSSVDIQG